MAVPLHSLLLEEVVRTAEPSGPEDRLSAGSATCCVTSWQASVK